VLQDHQLIETEVTMNKIFQAIQTVGGDNGWYYANWLWQLRGIMDRTIGGVGMRRGRRHPIEIRIGDAIDFWRVEKFEPGRSLKLKAEMKLPGQARLEFKVQSTPDQKSVFEQTATFLPENWFGFLYWYAIYPVHLLVFKNMAKNIIKHARYK
jgi:hypothetical protein